MYNDDVAAADDDDNEQGDPHQTEETHPLTLPNSCFTTVDRNENANDNAKNNVNDGNKV